MSKDQSDKGHDITPIGLGGSIRPKSFLDVVSIIENYFLAEKDGNKLPDNLLTFKGKIMVSEVGFKGAAVSAFISIFLAPFFIAVVEKYIPIFGSSEFTLFDQFFALALAVSFSLGYSLIMASVGKYYIGNLPRKTTNWLMLGLTTAGILKIVVAFVLYNSIYVLVLDETRISKFLLSFERFVSYESLNKIYKILMNIKPLLLTSANFIILSSLLMITIPWLFIWIASRKTKRAIAREERWS
jgi:hypothetical protein